MVSEKQLKANRRNAKLSTGPKETSKTKFNALKHGLCSNQVILSGESREEFDKLACEINEKFNPRDGLETILVEQIIFAFWKIRRCRSADKALIESESSFKGVNWTSLFCSGKMNTLTRYETRALNQVIKTMRLLKDLRN